MAIKINAQVTGYGLQPSNAQVLVVVTSRFCQSSPAAPTARAGAWALRVHERARGTDECRGLPQDDHAPWEGRKDALWRVPHMLRHACGYKLANQGVDTRNSELSPERFRDFWKN